MTPIKVKSDEARNSWRDMIDAAASGRSVIIERYNKPVAALISYEAFVELQGQIEDAQDILEARRILREWQKNPSTARPWEDIEAELIAEGRLDADDTDR